MSRVLAALIPLLFAAPGQARAPDRSHITDCRKDGDGLNRKPTDGWQGSCLDV